MKAKFTFLVLGATGGTGRRLTAMALADGHTVRALVRSPNSPLPRSPQLDVRSGSITDPIDTDDLVAGVDFVVAMIGDRLVQRDTQICAPFVQRLVPSMRRQGVKRLLYQAGGLSRPYGHRLAPALWMIRHTLARSHLGQHRDNDAVMAYLGTEANDIEWIVHRAGIGSDGPSKGELKRSQTKLSIATFVDCARYNYRTVTDMEAVHTSDLSAYARD